MRYFFLIYALVAVLVISVFGFRGDKFSQTPFMWIPDMDNMDRIDPQSSTDFFQDGLGSRQPVDQTVPHGFSPSTKVNEAPADDFGNELSFYHTGMYDDQVFGDGLPVKELGLTEENAHEFLKSGETVYAVHCSRCHGESANGKGVVVKHNINVRDRWAAIAYIKALQYSRSVPKEQVEEAFKAGSESN